MVTIGDVARAAGVSRSTASYALSGKRTISPAVRQKVADAVAELGLGKKASLRCKNFWALGFVYWMFGRDRAPTVEWLWQKFAKKPGVAEANIAALNAGHALAETAEVLDGFHGYELKKAHIEPGLYRAVTGAEAMAWGLAAAEGSGRVALSKPGKLVGPQVAHQVSRARRLSVTWGMP